MRIHTSISPLIFLLACLLPSSLSARDGITGATALLQNHSLSFVENKGQITDQYHHTRTDIQYKIASAGVNVFVGNGQLHYQWQGTSPNPSKGGEQRTSPDPSKGGVKNPWAEFTSPPLEGLGKVPGSVSTYRMDVTLIGANTHAEVISGDMQPDNEHYYMPQVGRAGATAHTFSKITYKNIYPGIDWVLYTSNNQLKYDFVVHPGGRVSDIQLSYDGANALTTDDNGALTAVTPMGTVTEQAPYSYETETGKAVASRFSRQGNTLGFILEDHSGTVTIDPLLAWATYYGGSGGDDYINDVTCDTAGNIYVTGQTISANNIATTGAHQNTFSGPTAIFDAFVAAFAKGGQRLWGSYFGDTLNDYGVKIACDAYNHVYVTGTAYSTQNIATPGAYQTALPGGFNPDAFLAKFDAGTGNLTWSTYFGGTESDAGNGVVCDPSGNIYIAGTTYSSTGIATPNAYHPNLNGYYDVFLAKFDSTGARIWGTYYGGASFELCKALAIDRYGLYISGNTSSTLYVASPGAFQDSLKGTQDAFVAKFNTAGQLAWSTYYGSATTDGNTVTCDSFGNVFLGGETTSDTGIATTGSYQSTFTAGGFDEAYIAKFDSTGQRIWSTYYGGNNTEYLFDMTCDPAGNLYATGGTASITNITTPNAAQPTNTGYNAFLAKFRNDGTREYGTYFGGNKGYEQGNAIAHDRHGNIYMGGSTGSDTGIATAGAFQPVFDGPYCGFLAAFSADTSVYIIQPFTDTLFCSSGATFDLHFAVMNHFELTNIFTVQLSDSTGSFANPTAIAAVMDSIGGTIACTFPSAAHGQHFRVRILANLPVDTSVNDGVNIVLSTVPTAPVTAGSNSPICTNDTLHLSATDTTAGVTYRWTTPGNTFVYGQTPALSGLHVSDSGNYYVSAMLNGCPSLPDTVMVNIKPSPAQPMDSTNSPICANDSLFVMAYDSTAGVTYQWAGPQNFSNTDSNFIISNAQTINTGQYIVTTTFNGCNSIPDTVAVTVHQLVVPSATILINPPGPVAPGQTIALTTVITNGGANPTLQWYINNVAVPGATTIPYYTTSVVNGDIIKLVVHSSDPCASPDSSVTYSGALGINDTHTAATNVNLYPNPNNGMFTINGILNNAADGTELDIEIFNVLGQIIYKDIAVASKNVFNKNIALDSDLPDGIYSLRVKTGEQESLLRFILQH